MDYAELESRVRAARVVPILAARSVDFVLSATAALTAGVPQVTYPLVEDQLFWAGRLHRIGLAPEPLDRLSPHSLAYALEDAVGLQPIVNETQAALRGEDGIAAAITRIENADTQPDNG